MLNASRALFMPMTLKAVRQATNGGFDPEETYEIPILYSAYGITKELKEKLGLD